MLANQELPLWNPYSFMGTPFLATYHSATLYPLNAIIALPNYTGWALYIYSQTLIAALSMYLLLSLWLKHKLARLFGAFIFSLGSLMCIWLELGIFAHALAWLPLSLFATERLIQTSKFRFFLLLSASQSLTILSGYAQITTYSFVVIAAYSITRSYHKSLQPILALVSSLLLTSIQLLPSLDLLQNSIRTSEAYARELNHGLLPIADTIRLFIADYFGNPTTRNYWGKFNYAESTGFIGTLSLPFLVYSFIYLKHNFPFKFFFGLLVVSLVLAFQNPISNFLYSLPIPLLTYSFASRMLVVTLLSCAMLVSLSVNQILNNLSYKKLTKATLLAWITLTLIVVATAITRVSTSNTETYTNLTVAIRNSILPLSEITLISAVMLVCLLITHNLNRYKKVLTYLTITIFFLILLFDLGRYFLKFNPFSDKSLIFPTTPSLEFLQTIETPFRIGREQTALLPPNTWIAYGLESFEGYDPLYLNRYAKFLNLLNNGSLNTTSASRYGELSSQNYSSRFLSAANVKYFIGTAKNPSINNGQPPNSPFASDNFKLVFKAGSSVIYENTSALPRAYFVKNTQLTPDFNLLSSADFDPLTTVAIPNSISPPNIQVETTTPLIQTYTPNSIKVSTNSESPQILILANTFDTNWKATIDDKPTKIFPANYIFQAVTVPAGNHIIHFYYLPNAFILGLCASLATLIILSIYTIISIYNKWI